MFLYEHYLLQSHILPKVSLHVNDVEFLGKIPSRPYYLPLKRLHIDPETLLSPFSIWYETTDP